jgi:hypothetical protein
MPTGGARLCPRRVRHGGATLLGWLAFGGSVHDSLMNAIAVLIITCPCAMALVVPAVQVVATGRLFKDGVLVKSGDALERLATAKSPCSTRPARSPKAARALLNAEQIAADALEPPLGSRACPAIRSRAPWRTPRAKGPSGEDLKTAPAAG